MEETNELIQLRKNLVQSITDLKNKYEEENK